jgi:hypothetical protein
VILQVDVTAAVLSEKRVEELQRQQRMLLQQILPEQVIDVLLQKLRGSSETPAQKLSAAASGSFLLRTEVGELLSLSQRGRQAPDGSEKEIREGHSLYELSTFDHAWQNYGSFPSAVELPDLTEHSLQDPGNPGSTISFQGQPSMDQLMQGGSFEEVPNPDLVLPPSLLQVLGSSASLRSSLLLERGHSCSSDSSAITSNSLISQLITNEALHMRGRGKESVLLTQQNVMDFAAWHESVTVLFCDIQGFTAMCSQLHPAQVMLLLNDLFSRFDALLEKHDVYKVETIGGKHDVHKVETIGGEEYPCPVSIFEDLGYALWLCK